ncbi:DnaA_N domain-containing protein [Clostridium neonatale]|uniref:DnaA N-terminal domain-containing protein n=1 Tax=Clostridium neonatale TaxID=137838 RepID=UPI001DF75D69|nr:DnaA N-terminal domain-containing protein [Clostridium neonatale]CAG9702656.1 DnaA_N domain-containing protein [Clostridium neonatale]
MAGWQKIYRDIQEHWLWEDKPFSRGQAWIDLILLVNHEDNKALIDGELVEVKRGSKITSLRKLAEQWGWSTTKAKKFLEQLKKDNMIAFESDNKKTLVTIENYDVYQGKESTEITVKKQLDNTEVTQKNFKSNSEVIQKKTNKNDKEYIKNDKEGEEKKEEIQPLSFPTPTHELIFKQFGEISYKTWLSNLDITDDEIVIYAANKPFEDLIKKRYVDAIETLTGKTVSVKGKEVS